MEAGEMVLVDGRRDGWCRPLALPGDIDHSAIPKAHGVVVLPPHVFWSAPEKQWDLDDRRQRLQVYEIVLTQGTDDDVRRFIEVDELIDLWTDLWLPPYVRRAWAAHLKRLRGADLEC